MHSIFRPTAKFPNSSAHKMSQPAMSDGNAIDHYLCNGCNLIIRPIDISLVHISAALAQIVVLPRLQQNSNMTLC